MSSRTTKPFGSWKSPVTSDLIVSETVGFTDMTTDREDIYWVELRLSEGGRHVIVRLSADGELTDITPCPFNVRTRVHEYGGGSFTIKDSTIYFSNFDDQRIYKQLPESKPQPITPRNGFRYADGIIDSVRNRMICVREEHSASKKEPVINTLVSIDLKKGGAGKGIISGNDFYSSPRISPDRSTLCWLTWNHPHMPWDSTELWTGKLENDGTVTHAQRVAGGDKESIFQPQWSPDGILHFVSDRTGWWNLYRLANGSAEPLCGMETEFGKPQWVFAMSTYAFRSEECIICSYATHGKWTLAALNTTTGKLEPFEISRTEISHVNISSGKPVFIAASPTEAPSILRLDTDSHNIEVLKRSTTVGIEEGYLSIPEEIEFPTEGGLTSYAFFYNPQNKDYQAPDGELPPLIVKIHGGPTSAASTALSPGIQYWTSRGFAVVDVNHGGGTGYGRAFRERLNEQWGIVDVDDCVNAARYLVKKNKVNRDHLAIRGGSAGGYTTLCALTFRDTFRAGASYFGISDLELLLEDTHKFESRYFDGLIGPYPEKRSVYRERSPIHSIDSLSCPLIIFQGLEDKIVPPGQAELIYEALLKKKVPVAYLAFEGEQHGFRRAENIKRTLDAELYFYSKIFGFIPADTIPPVPIKNLTGKS